MAINLFVDLRQWEEAKVFAAGTSNIDSSDLVRRQAEWAEETKDWKKAAEMYLTAGEPLRACRIIGECKGKDWQTVMIEIVRNIPKSEIEVLETCGKFYTESEEDDYAKEVYLKLDNFSMLMGMLVRKKNWSEATKLADEHEGKFDKKVSEFHTVRQRVRRLTHARRRCFCPTPNGWLSRIGLTRH